MSDSSSSSPSLPLPFSPTSARKTSLASSIGLLSNSLRARLNLPLQLNFDATTTQSLTLADDNSPNSASKLPPKLLVELEPNKITFNSNHSLLPLHLSQPPPSPEARIKTCLHQTPVEPLPATLPQPPQLIIRTYCRNYKERKHFEHNQT